MHELGGDTDPLGPSVFPVHASFEIAMPQLPAIDAPVMLNATGDALPLTTFTDLVALVTPTTVFENCTVDTALIFACCPVPLSPTNCGLFGAVDGTVTCPV